MQQLRRNFDLGVSQTDNSEVFGSISSESEGIRYIKRMTRLLVRERAAYYIPYFYINSAFRLVGYKLGKGYKKLPERLILACTMNRNYWRHR
ncbi:MAG: glycosyltransferase family 2 protein, partial [Lachnospiraceae bacterium]